MPISELIQKNFAWSQWRIIVNQTTMKTKLFVLCTMLCAMLFAGCKPNEPATSNKVITGNVTDITRSSALFHGTVNVDISTYNNVEFGIMIAETKEELNAREGEMYEADILIGKDFKLDIYYLSPATSYYYCAWLLLNNTQYEFGNIKEFQTLGASEPMVTTSEATQISLRTATVGGNVTDDGDSEVVERGICYSTSANPSIIWPNKKIVCGSGLGEFTCDLTDLEKDTKYFVRAYATNSVGTTYGKEVSFTTLSAPLENGHEYVDLGLSVKWATMNVGANRPEDYGDYFAWGETTTKTTYSWSTYKHCNGSSSTLTKYNNSSSCGTVDNKTSLELSDDAARANWGGAWRIPTYDEFTELIANCTEEWSTQNGVNGYKVISKINGNSIFLPATGYRDGSSLHDAGSKGRYWSSVLSTSYSDVAWSMDFNSSKVLKTGCSRRYGFTIRPVCP